MLMKKIAVVCGGYSKEEIISLKSAGQIAQIIDQSKYEIYKVFVNKEKWVVIRDNAEIHIDKNDFSFTTEREQKITFDAVFMAIHGTPGEDGKLQSYFEMLNIPVTTCNSFVSSLTFNKYACKLYLKEFGILTAKSVVLNREDSVDFDALVNNIKFPMFVKPNNGGSSFGVSKVSNKEELPMAIEKAFNEDTQIIIEEFIEGREFTCGAFKNRSDSIVFPITEIVSENEFFDYEAKYEGKSDEITPANLPVEQFEHCQQLTSRIYDVLGCSGVVRIDYLFRNGKFYFMEVNTVPGMSAESIIPQQARAYGLSVTDFYTMLIDDAISRNIN